MLDDPSLLIGHVQLLPSDEYKGRRRWQVRLPVWPGWAPARGPSRGLSSLTPPGGLNLSRGRPKSCGGLTTVLYSTVQTTVLRGGRLGADHLGHPQLQVTCIIFSSIWFWSHPFFSNLSMCLDWDTENFTKNTMIQFYNQILFIWIILFNNVSIFVLLIPNRQKKRLAL